MAPVLISLDITPKTPADRQKLARALQVLAAEDAQFEVRNESSR
jgi:translation elongation factor EF-G